MDKRDGGVLQFEKFQVTSLDNFRMQNGVTKGYLISHPYRLSKSLIFPSLVLLQTSIP
ncbi:hypothetical protein AAMO2058_000183700 [Amorphochlora amoebiformis]